MAEEEKTNKPTKRSKGLKKPSRTGRQSSSPSGSSPFQLPIGTGYSLQGILPGTAGQVATAASPFGNVQVGAPPAGDTLGQLLRHFGSGAPRRTMSGQIEGEPTPDPFRNLNAMRESQQSHEMDKANFAIAREQAREALGIPRGGYGAQNEQTQYANRLGAVVGRAEQQLADEQQQFANLSPWEQWHTQQQQQETEAEGFATWLGQQGAASSQQPATPFVPIQGFKQGQASLQQPGSYDVSPSGGTRHELLGGQTTEQYQTRQQSANQLAINEQIAALRASLQQKQGR